MSNLISGKEALIALANGKEVLYIGEAYKDKPNCSWGDAKEVEVEDFLNDAWSFKLKPCTITLNGVELNKCYSLGIDRVKNEISIQFKDESDADELHDLLSRLYGFKE